MNSVYLPFFIPFLAGLFTVFGYFIVYLPSIYQDKIISISFAFSSGVMLMISFGSLIPESWHYLEQNDIPYNLFFLFCFFIVGIFLEKGISFLEGKSQHSSLYQLGIISMLALMLHNIPEGMTTFLTMRMNRLLGIRLSVAIALHNIPEGIAIAIPIYYATHNYMKSFLLTLIAGFSELIGAIVAMFFFQGVDYSFFMSIILAITAGIMTSISLLELLPKSFSYHFLKFSYFSFLFGCLLMFFCMRLF